MNKQYNFEQTNIEETGLNQTLDLNQAVGLFETVTTVPTGKPTNLINQLKIYTNGATLRFYWYDAKNNVWHYVTATA